MATHPKKATIPGRGRGRPTLYRPEYADVAYELTTLNYTTGDLAEEFGVDIRTITNWKNIFLEFRHAITRGRVDNRRRQEREMVAELRALFEGPLDPPASAVPPRAPSQPRPPAPPRPHRCNSEPPALSSWLSREPVDPVPMDDILDRW